MGAIRNGIKELNNRSCTPKKEVLSQEEAIQRAAERTKREGWLFNHYYCPFHKAYHVGHAFPRVRPSQFQRR